MNNRLCNCLRIYLILLIVFPHAFTSVNAQIKTDSIAVRLSEEGFENVTAAVEGSRIIIGFENRLFRFKADGFIRALELIYPFTQNTFTDITLLLLNDNVPVIKFNLPARIIEKFYLKEIDTGQLVVGADISFDIDDDWSKLESIEGKNSSFFKFDLTLKPSFKAEFGDYDNPVKDQINLIPALNSSWWKGMRIVTEMVVPLHNEFKGEGEYVRPGILSLNQVIRFDDNYFLAASMGYFSRNRFGFNLESMKLFDNGNFILSGNLGYTGYASIYKNILLYSPLYLWTGCLNLSYRLNIYDLTIGVTAGRFISEDKSIRFDVSRKFGEISIGFFATKTLNGEANGGFNFSIPLFPSKYCKPGIVRVRSADNFSWEYKVRGLTPGLSALNFSTGLDLKSFYDNVNPAYIKNFYNRN